MSAGLTSEEPDDGWVVRPVTGAMARKPYLCPGCEHEVRAGEPHVVAWRTDGVAGEDGPGGFGDRRHWHTACWRGRARRRPTTRYRR